MLIPNFNTEDAKIYFLFPSQHPPSKSRTRNHQTLRKPSCPPLFCGFTKVFKPYLSLYTFPKHLSACSVTALTPYSESSLFQIKITTSVPKSLHQDWGPLLFTLTYFFVTHTYSLFFKWKIKSCYDTCFPQ